MTTGHFIMDIPDKDDQMHEIEIEYEITRIHDETNVDFRVIGNIPGALGLSRSSLIHRAEELFWRRDLLTELGEEDDQPYFD